MCNYQGYEFGAGRYPDSYCIDGKLHDADSDFLNDEDVPCPMCDREAAIQWWFNRWKDMSEPDDNRGWEEINAEHLARAKSLVDDIRLHRGIPLPRKGEELWCLHILGPDDVHAAPSKEHAERAAERFNEIHGPVAASAGVMCRAVAAPWPHSPESHAEDVGLFEADWLQPTKGEGE